MPSKYTKTLNELLVEDSNLRTEILEIFKTGFVPDENKGAILMGRFIAQWGMYEVNSLDEIDYIDKNFRKELTLVELADLIDLSPQYLCRLFKEGLSLRPFEYLARKRIQQAKLLLLEDKLNINEIAAEVGYNDCSYFCAVFKKHEMLSPAEFRSLHKKAGN